MRFASFERIDDFLEAIAALLEVCKHIEAGGRGGENHDIALRRGTSGGHNRALEAVGFDNLGAAVIFGAGSQRRLYLRRGRSDEHDLFRAVDERLRERGIWDMLVISAADYDQRLIKRTKRGFGAGRA